MGEKRSSKARGLDDFGLVFVKINRNKKGAGKLCLICLEHLFLL